jgi:hypothetical protein
MGSLLLFSAPALAGTEAMTSSVTSSARGQSRVFKAKGGTKVTVNGTIRSGDCSGSYNSADFQLQRKSGATFIKVGTQKAALDASFTLSFSTRDQDDFYRIDWKPNVAEDGGAKSCKLEQDLTITYEDP